MGRKTKNEAPCLALRIAPKAKNPAVVLFAEDGTVLDVRTQNPQGVECVDVDVPAGEAERIHRQFQAGRLKNPISPRVRAALSAGVGSLLGAVTGGIAAPAAARGLGALVGSMAGGAAGGFLGAEEEARGGGAVGGGVGGVLGPLGAGAGAYIATFEEDRERNPRRENELMRTLQLPSKGRW